MSEQAVAFDRDTLRRFVRAVKDFFTSEVRWRARGLFALLIVFALTVNGLNVINSYVGRDFITAISHRDEAGFVREAVLFVAVLAGTTVVAVFYRFTEERLGLFWRVWLTKRVIHRYLADRTYLYLKQSSSIENPDQRIAEDVRAFTTTTLSFTLMFMNGALAVLSFAGVLWTISRLLFVVSIGYAVIGTVATIYLGRPLMGLNSRQANREAAFRSDLIHVREHGESIGLLRHEGRLTARLLRRIDGLADNFRRMTSVNRNLSFFTTGYNYMIQLIPALIVAPLFIRGKVEFGVITQSAFAFTQLLGAFSLIINQFQAISTFAAVTARLSAMVGAVDKRLPGAHTATEVDGVDGRIAYDGLTLFSPEAGQEILKNLTADIPGGTKVLVVGSNEAARNALFRATAGIWPDEAGTLVRPPLDKISFLPQRPYLPPGTLRDVLVRTGREKDITDDQIATALHGLGLDSIQLRAGGLDTEQDWSAFLSLGEQQLLALTRMIFARPAVAVLDRVTASVKPSQLREVLRRLDENSIPYIIFAEDAESVELYDAVLAIDSDGGWTWSRTGRAATAA